MNHNTVDRLAIVDFVEESIFLSRTKLQKSSETRSKQQIAREKVADWQEQLEN